jgi:ABC-type amino acid transport system permease subunit
MASELEELAAGALGTMRIATIVLICGGATGFLLGLWSARTNVARHTIHVVAVALSITPFLALLFFFHYPFEGLLGVVWSPEIVSIVLLSSFVSIQTSDVFAQELNRARAGLQEAALVLGLKQSTFLWKIVAPSAAEASLPRFLTLAIVTIHMTMFTSLIGVEELFRAAQRINAQSLHPVQVYGAMALFYAAICLPLYSLARVWNTRLSRDRDGAHA